MYFARRESVITTETRNLVEVIFLAALVLIGVIWLIMAFRARGHKARLERILSTMNRVNIDQMQATTELVEILRGERDADGRPVSRRSVLHVLEILIEYWRDEAIARTNLSESMRRGRLQLSDTPARVDSRGAGLYPSREPRRAWAPPADDSTINGNGRGRHAIPMPGEEFVPERATTATALLAPVPEPAAVADPANDGYPVPEVREVTGSADVEPVIGTLDQLATDDTLGLGLFHEVLDRVRTGDTGDQPMVTTGEPSE